MPLHRIPQPWHCVTSRMHGRRRQLSCGLVRDHAMPCCAIQVWICPFCMGRNHFPPHYQVRTTCMSTASCCSGLAPCVSRLLAVQGISDDNLPAELYPAYSTIEYTMPKTQQPHPPTYLFLIDTCVSEDELNACKAAILQVCNPCIAPAHNGSIEY